MSAFVLDASVTAFDRLTLTRTHFNMSLRAQRGNLVAVAMVVCQRVFNLNEIATSLRSSQ